MPKKIWIDYARVAATIAIIVIHVSTVYFIQYGKISDLLWISANFISVLSRYAVPLFVMISGALLLGREMEIFEFYKKRTFRLVPAIIFWSLFFICFRYIFESKGNMDTLLLSLKGEFSKSGSFYYHLWYLTMFIFLMLIAPFLNNYLCGKKPEGRQLLMLPIIGAILFALHQTSTMAYILNGKGFGWYTKFIWFIIYFMMGYIIDQYYHKIKLNKLLVVIALIAVILTGFFVNFYLVAKHNIMKDWLVMANEGVIVFLMALVVFYLFRSGQHIFKENKIIRILSNASFGIYLIHPVFMYFTFHRIPKVYQSNIGFMFLAIIAVLLASAITVTLLRKFKIFRMVT
jgi:surface polysaccharide O-acyltransferase-like enzyme